MHRSRPGVVSTRLRHEAPIRCTPSARCSPSSPSPCSPPRRPPRAASLHPKPDAPPVATGATRGGPEQDARKTADDGVDPQVARDVSHHNLQQGKPAIGGYDPVAYFPEGGGKPKPGKKDNAFVYRGVTFWFASPENLATFRKDPRRYEPAYGGWCAYAMGKTGEKVEVEPKSFRIQGGRLFLFYKSFFNDTRSSWIEDETALLPKADANWRKTSGEAPPAPKPARQDAQGVQRTGEQRGANGV